MIQKFVDRFMAQETEIKAKLAELPPKYPSYQYPSYRDIVKIVVEALHEDYDGPDPDRIHEINDGDYQGTLVYVIAADGYQPHEYWYVRVFYGSCSGCDTLEHICTLGDYDDDGNPVVTEQQVKDLWTLALHIVQGLKSMDDQGV